MNNKDDGLDISLGNIIDQDEAFLKEHIKGKDLGYVSSVKNLLAVTYNELVGRKNDTIKKCNEFLNIGDSVSAEGCSILVQQIYLKLQSIEDKYNYLSKYVADKNKSIKGAN